MTAVRHGIVTGLSVVAVSAAAAVAGLYLSRRFGRTAETDGLLAAYAVYLVLFLGVQSARMVAAPDLTRAASEGRLASELSAYVTTFVLAGAPALMVALPLSAPLGALLTGGVQPEAAAAAGGALAWLVPAAVAQLFAALAASALAALDDYGVAAGASAAGAVAGALLFVGLAGSHGVGALAWGVALNGLVSAVIPVAVLVAKGAWPGRRTERLRLVWRLRRLIESAALPVALQGLYLIAVRFCADLGVGVVTLFSYAYMAAAVLIAATASSMALVTAVPLTRRPLVADETVAHVVHVSWVSLCVVAGGAAAAATVGDGWAMVFGPAFGGDAGRQLGLLILGLGPWTVMTIVLSVSLPLLFVTGGPRFAVPLAVLALVVDVPVSLALRKWAGAAGVELALTLSTALVLVGLMARLTPGRLASLARALGRMVLVEAGLALITFGPVALAFGDGIVPALLGLAAYLALHALLRPRGLREAWTYVRGLHDPPTGPVPAESSSR